MAPQARAGALRLQHHAAQGGPLPRPDGRFWGWRGVGGSKAADPAHSWDDHCQIQSQRGAGAAPVLLWQGEDDMTDSLRDYTNLPKAAVLLTILDMSAWAKYVMDMEEITPAFVEAFVNDFLPEKLKPEPI